MNAIELRDVTLALGGHNVLANISLNIPAGQFIGVLGPNGAGKTTLMRAILGLLSPTNGAIRVLDKPATRGNPAIGYRPQTAAALPALRISGWDFVACVADGFRPGLPILTAETRAQVHRALELVGAEQLARRPLTELSGGERQRLLLAQALIGDPQIAPPRRTPDQPRSTPPAGGCRTGQAGCKPISESPCSSAHMN
ncbi:MAG: ATP-binding cassette domain-containing protein [Methylovirgula sp.]